MNDISTLYEDWDGSKWVVNIPDETDLSIEELVYDIENNNLTMRDWESSKWYISITSGLPQ